MGTHDMALIMSITLVLVLFSVHVGVFLLAIDRYLHRFA